ncbi:MAG: NUDIX domain-containing protein [Cyclobacteriaceae bacterium]
MNNSSSPTHIIDKSAWIEIQEGKILMARSHGKDIFYIPGGKRESGESDTQALIREIQEELSVELLPDSIILLEVFQAQAHGQAEGVEVKMQCYSGVYQGTLQPAAEIESLDWFTYSDVTRVGPVDKLIFRWLHKQNLLSD